MLYVIVGPTSTGKTSLALELCKKFNGELISADSRQVVKKMNIGTGKFPMNANLAVTKNESNYVLDGVTVWGYDLVEPDAYFSAFDFATYASAKISEIQARSKNIFLVGGTGFYIDPVIGRTQFAEVSPNIELRTQLESQTLDKLVPLLIDPSKVADIKNKARVVRALEIQLGAKKPTAPLKTYVPNKIVGLTSSRETLYKNADAWVDVIWQNGLFDEVRDLLLGESVGSWRLKGLVYKSVVDYITNSLSEADAIQRIKFDIHAYIRRQQTYFKKNPQIQWFDISEIECRQKIVDLVQ